MSAPTTFLDSPVPDAIREVWTTWAAAGWRSQQHRNHNILHVPDQRFSVRPPAGMCTHHRQAWIDYRDMRFDWETGARWPGEHGSPFQYVGHNMREVREQRRVEWDEKASAQMQLIERICLSGRSPNCTEPVVDAAPVAGSAVTA